MTNLQEKEKMIKEFRSYKEYNIASIADAVNVRNDLRARTKNILKALREEKLSIVDVAELLKYCVGVYKYEVKSVDELNCLNDVLVGWEEELGYIVVHIRSLLDYTL